MDLVYDDECGFCTWGVERLLDRDDGALEPVGFSELSEAQRRRLPADYEQCMHLLTDDELYSCGEAAERTVAQAVPALGPLFALCRHVPGYATLREWIYRWVADHRALLGRYRSATPPARRS